jgi:arylsulfatase A-like enzyme
VVLTPDLDPRRVWLGTTVRQGVCIPADAPLEAAVAAPIRAVRFGAGQQPEASGSAAPRRVTLRISQQRGEDWRLLHEQTLEVSPQAWLDLSVKTLAAPAETSRLRFSLRPEKAGGPPVCFGGMVFMRALRADESPPPNVILFSLDTLGAGYLGAYGNPRPVSSHLDAILARSFRFDRAFAEFPNTFVSHSSLFTGLYPAHHGRYPGGGPGSWPPLDSLVSRLAAHGYHTAAITEDAYVGSERGFAHGFDHWDNGDVGEEPATWGNSPGTFRSASAWLEAHGRTAPFFLFLHTYEVHAPYRPRDAAARRIADASTPGDTRQFDPKALHRAMRRQITVGGALSDADVRRLRALYDGEIHYLDRQMGAFFDELAAAGLLDDTLVVITSDHGELFGEHGMVGHVGTHNRVLHVPLGFHWPGRIAPGRSEQPVQLVDVLPTVFDLVGVPVPASLDGRSLAAELLGDRSDPPARTAIAESSFKQQRCRAADPDACWIEIRIAQDARFKRVRSRSGRRDTLHDLEADSGEENDVSDLHPDVVRRLDAALERVYGSEWHRNPHREVPGEEGTHALDPEIRMRLEALGYIE